MRKIEEKKGDEKRGRRGRGKGETLKREAASLLREILCHRKPEES